MNHFICFVLVFAMYYRFGTACKSNIIEIINQLGHGIVLQFHCTRPSSGYDASDCDTGNKEGEFTKYDSKLDFDCKRIPKLESNAKITQKPCEITTIPL